MAVQAAAALARLWKAAAVVAVLVAAPGVAAAAAPEVAVAPEVAAALKVVAAPEVATQSARFS